MWTIIAQKQLSGTYTLAASDHVWWTGGPDNSSTSYVIVGNYNDGMHIYASDDHTHQATIHNTKYLDPAHVSIDGSGSTALSALPSSSCGLKFVFDTSDLGGASVVTNSAKFYSYDGTTDNNPWAGITLQATGYSGSTPTGTQWVAANGSGSALTFADQAAATSHTYYVATSVTPNSSGAKAGRIKMTLNYV
jgi:hypothetical protein